MVNSSVRSPQRCYLPRTSDADPSKEQMGCHDALVADSLRQGNGCWCCAATGGRRGERRAVHSPRAFGFPSAAYLLGLRNRLPGQCDRRTACSGCPTAALAARFRPRLMQPALSLSIAYLAPQPQLAASGWGRARARRGGWGNGAAASSSPSHSTRTIRSAAWPSHRSISGRAGERRATARSAAPSSASRRGATRRLVPCVQVTGRSVLRSEEHTSELQSRGHLVCRLLLEKKKSSHQRPDRLEYLHLLPRQRRAWHGPPRLSRP